MTVRSLLLAFAPVILGLSIAVWIRDGGAVLALLVVTLVGYAVVWLVPAGVSGYSATAHSKREAEAIRALHGTEQRRELTR